MSAEPMTKAAQEAAESALVEKSIKDLYKLVEANLGSVGGIDSAATIARVDRADLRRALDDKGRYIAVDHIMRIGARMRQFNASASTLVGAGLVRPMGLLVFPLVELTTEEENRRMKNWIRAQPFGEQQLQAALEKP